MDRVLQYFLRKNLSKEEINGFGVKPIMLLNNYPNRKRHVHYTTNINLLCYYTKKILIVEPTKELETRTLGKNNLYVGMIINVSERKSVKKLVKILWVKDFREEPTRELF